MPRLHKPSEGIPNVVESGTWFPDFLLGHHERLRIEPPPDVDSESWTSQYAAWLGWMDHHGVTQEDAEAASLRMQGEGAENSYRASGRTHNPPQRWFADHLPVFRHYVQEVRCDRGL